MDKPTRGTQWLLLASGCVLFLLGGSAWIRWILTGVLMFEIKKITYTGGYAAVPIVAFTIIGLVLIVTSGRNLQLWR